MASASGMPATEELTSHGDYHKRSWIKPHQHTNDPPRVGQYCQGGVAGEAGWLAGVRGTKLNGDTLREAVPVCVKQGLGSMSLCDKAL